MPQSKLERSNAVFHPEYIGPPLKRSNAVIHPDYLRISPAEAARNLEAGREFRFAIRDMERRKDPSPRSR